MLKYNINMLYMFFLVLKIYKNIIKINNVENIKKPN